jgi:perosamine synthetase
VFRQSGSLRVLPPVGGRLSSRLLCGSFQKALGAAADVGPERQLTRSSGRRYWIPVSSGRAALSLSLKALHRLRPDCDEVVIPAYTSYSVPAAVVRAGLRVRLCDVEMETLGLFPKALEYTFTSKTLCVVPNHLYGVPCQIKSICEMARERQVPVVEDAAQAMGALSGGRPIGSFGDVTIFSLSRGKCLPAAGGGLIGTDDEALSEQCRRLLENGERQRRKPVGVGAALKTALLAIFIRPSLYWMPAALPFLKLGRSIYDPVFPIGPLSRFQEALAGRLLSTLEELRDVRQTNAVRLREAMGEVSGCLVIWPRMDDQGAFLRFPVLVRPAARAAVLCELKRQGLGAMEGYPLPLSEVPGIRPHLAGPDQDFPNARELSRQLMSLPTHPWVSPADIAGMTEVLKQWA